MRSRTRWGFISLALAASVVSGYLGCRAPEPASELLAGARAQFSRAADRLRVIRPGSLPGQEQPTPGRALRAIPPARADQPLRIEWAGLAVELRPVAARPTERATVEGVAIYAGAHREVDVFQVATAERVEELLVLRGPRAPSRFEYDVAVHGGELLPSGEVVDGADGARLRLARPWALDSAGRWVDARLEIRGSRVAVELDPRGLQYPILLDPAFEVTSAALVQARYDHALALLGDGRVLACGGTANGTTALSSCELHDPRTGTWSTAGSMTAARMGATATALLTGQVLICGGGTSSCELFDPVSATSSPGPAMSAVRSAATATLLRTGEVLMTGGAATGNAELLVAGAWTAAGSISARSKAAAVLLPDGKVLVVGGLTGASPVTTADLFDPVTKSWSTGPALATARAEHTASLLRDGRVLVAGGTSGSATLATAELFDGSAWTTVALPNARRRHAAALLTSGKLLLLGGSSGTAALSLVDVFDPAAGTWSDAVPLRTARERAGAVVLPSGAVFVAGGLGTVALASSERHNPAADWAQVRPMTTGRTNHTATALSNGKVLVAGGNAGSGAFSSAELYDPAANSWSSAGAMSVGRADHTATLLQNGKVLIVGGSGLASADLYDPSLNSWQSAGTMTVARTGHAATLLADGRVLVTGGDALSSADTYDPTTNTWTPVSAMIDPHSRHTATRLLDGRVLVAGGTGAPQKAELYDPGSNSWAQAPAMPSAHAFHSATLLPDGRVLVVGGSQGQTLAELFDPIAVSWTAAAPPLQGHSSKHVAVRRADGSVLVVGGQYANAYGQSQSSGAAELYEAASNRWLPAGNLSEWRWGLAAALLSNGRVFVCGGQGSTGILASAEVLDPGSHRWTQAGSLAGARKEHTASLLSNGKVLVAGGMGPLPVTSAELYDPVTDGWSAAGSMPVARAGHTATLLPSGKLLVAGGRGLSGSLASAALYDPATNSWALAGSMLGGRFSHTATSLPDGRVLVVGGWNAGPLSTAELYDPQTNAWTATPQLSSPRDRHTATLLANGTVLVTGGSGTALSDLSSAELFNPSTGGWTAANPMGDLRVGHFAVLLASGDVLVGGGSYTDFDGTWEHTSTELYKPSTGSWVSSASMSWHRVGQPALLLRSGRVLVVGGHEGESFDQATGRWSSAGSMPVDSSGHTLTLLPSGKVLLAGGSTTTSATLPDAWLYDPGLDSQPGWRPQLNPPVGVVLRGGPTTFTGAGFRGGPEAHGGTSPGAASNSPVISLDRLGGGQRWFGPSSFSEDALTVTFPANLELGHHLMTVHVAGVPSEGVVLTVRPGALGEPCVGSSQCSSGQCVDQVCCDAGACGACQSCALAGGAGGCEDLPRGTDDVFPAGTCTNANTCDGDAGCRLKNAGGCDAGAQCASSQCVDAVCCASGCTSTCQGCAVPGSEGSCVSLPRLAVDDAAALVCLAPDACDGDGGCRAGLGVPCSSSSQCASGFCADNVCCNADCLAQCLTCANPGSAGTCGAVAATLPDSPGCNAPNACAGDGGCRSAQGQTCAADGDCASGFCVDAVCCDGACAGPCQACGPSGSCGFLAAGQVDAPGCAGALACDGNGGCKLARGQPCDAGGQCVEGYCVDGTCCGEACTATCRSCANDAGLCTTPVAAGVEDLQPAASCAQPYACNGAGECRRQNGQPSSDAGECASGFSADGVCCEQACTAPCLTCAASPGACTPVAAGQEDPSAATACVGANACDGQGACKAKQGQPCAIASACASGLCVDQRCCDRACAGTCEACDVAGKLGTCSFVPLGVRDPATCSGTADACNGAGACKLANGQSCAGGVAGCASSLCADGVCCDTSCAGTCETCLAPLGACTSIAAGLLDPPGCQGESACTGDRECKKVLGQPCGAGADCLTGHCADGMCCDRACDGGACERCSSGGVCRPLAQGSVCFEANTPCQAQASCDGTTAGCVSDALQPAGTLCRAAVGSCDLPELCSGAGKDCPTNELVAERSVCSVGTSSGQCQEGICVPAGPPVDDNPDSFGLSCGCGASDGGLPGLWAGLVAATWLLRGRRVSKGPLLVVLALLAPWAASAEDGSSQRRLKIAVMTLQAGPGVDERTAELVTETFVAAIQQRPGLAVISSKDLSTALGFERQQQLLGCSEDTRCLVEIAGALDADLLVSGTLGKLGESLVFNVQLFDLKKTVVQQRVSRRLDGATEAAFLDASASVAGELFGEAPQVVEPVRRWSVMARAQLRPASPATGASGAAKVDVSGAVAALVGLQISRALIASVGVVGTRSPGAMLRVAWTPFNAEGKLRPIVAAELTMLFTDPVSVGPGVSLGVEYLPAPWIAVGLEVPALYFLLSPESRDRGYVFAGPTLALKL